MVVSRKPVLYMIVCAAPPAETIDEFIRQVQQAGWDVCVIATPHATRWIDMPTLETLTGHVVRVDYKLPGEGDPLPKADAIIVIPATFNTVNKWAAGIGDNLAVSLLCEALGNGQIPLLLIPCVKMDLVRHPAFARSIALLRDCNVHVLHEPERYKSPQMVPCQEILAELQRIYHAYEKAR
ncbi:flavoprotein [Dictyobacter aurantiacus]|uniref:Flavoprotein n=1 Tax=Dictyobacter aurantiacus TaxID=1936993 RepID=A0A401ZRT8_9CHLR|nr:flavoprotein [Dictyobacter aurantiacus]GCE09490.1 flavoprotein [Dictyobacter aurantiacus]